MNGLPLQGLRVADFSQGIAGPYCAMLLGDLGAEVIKLEPPRGDWIRVLGRKVEGNNSPLYIAMNRNKKSLCLEMKHPEGLAMAREVVAKSQIIVESFRPGVMGRFGLDYHTVHAAQPDLVYVSITGFGPEGPYVELPGSDSVLQAMGGIMALNGEGGGEPLRVGMFMVDLLTGMTGYQGALAALLARGVAHPGGGLGQLVETSLLDAIVAFQAPLLAEYRMYGLEPERNGNVNSFVAPSGVFKTRDGYILMTALNHQWEKCCQALERPDLLREERFASNESRLAHREALLEILRPILTGRTTAEWLERFRAGDLLCAPINMYPDLVADPQVAVNDLLCETPHPVLGNLPGVRNPVRFSGMKLPTAPPPMLGEHSRLVASELLGRTTAQVDALIGEGVLIAG